VVQDEDQVLARGRDGLDRLTARQLCRTSVLHYDHPLEQLAEQVESGDGVLYLGASPGARRGR